MEPLSDPKNDRTINSFPPPPHKPLNSELMFPSEMNSSFKLSLNFAINN